MKRASLSILFMLLTASITNISSERGWHGIVPLQSTRKDVEKLLGHPKSKCNCFYSLANENVIFEYTDRVCSEDSSSGWKVPLDTVVSISVYPLNTRWINEHQINKTRYKIEKDPELPGITHYTSIEDGLIISADNDKIMGYHYGPSAKDRHLNCHSIKMPPQIRIPCVEFISPFDPSGSYYIKEKGYSEFDYFTLKARNDGNGISGKGFVVSINGTHFNFETVVITKDDLSFETVKINGINYKFEGKWHNNLVFSRSSDLFGEELLGGVLQRFKDDKMIGKIDTTYIYQPVCY
jgi:hypothetical protein